MKTAIQQLKEWAHNDLIFKDNIEEIAFNEQIEKMLLVEREHIEQAYGDGLNSFRFEGLNRNQYFDLIFNQAAGDGWISVEDKTMLPPHEVRLQVKDCDGNEGIAFPTYFPFKIERRDGDEKKPFGWRGTVVPTENHWDGGWMIDVTEYFGIGKIGKITHWRIPREEKIKVILSDDDIDWQCKNV